MWPQKQERERQTDGEGKSEKNSRYAGSMMEGEAVLGKERGKANTSVIELRFSIAVGPTAVSFLSL